MEIEQKIYPKNKKFRKIKFIKRMVSGDKENFNSITIYRP